MSEDTGFCSICALRVHRVWPESQSLEVVKMREPDSDGMVWRHHLEPQGDRHDPVVLPRTERAS